MESITLMTSMSIYRNIEIENVVQDAAKIIPWRDAYGSTRVLEGDRTQPGIRPPDGTVPRWHIRAATFF
jgi:hypothetical protein